MKRLLLIPLLVIALISSCFAQADRLIEANEKYQDGDLNGARAILDQLVKEPDLADRPEVWVLRGFVYKDLYKSTLDMEAASVLRDEALASLYIGIKTDTDKQYVSSSLAAYDFLTSTLFNDAAQALNTMDEVHAIALFQKYKDAVSRIAPQTSFTAQDVEFTNALGTVYTKRFSQDRENTMWYDKAVDAYMKVLRMDSSNYGANYNLATLYYNRGVYKIQRISADNDIPSLQEIQAVSREFFTLALPYMLKAHDMNPTRKETVLGLEGINYSLQNEKESRHYRNLYEELDQEERQKPKN